MADPVRVSAASVVGRQTAPDNPGLKRMNLSFNAIFSAAAHIILDMNVLNQKDVFGGPVRSLFMDNSSNPSEVGVYVQGSDQYFTVPAFAEGVFSIDAVLNTIMEFTTNGGATDQVTITVYNWEKPPSVWYRYGASNKDIPDKVYGPNAAGTDLDVDTFNNPVLVGAAETATNILHMLRCDNTGALIISTISAILGAIYGAETIGVAPAFPGVLQAVLDNAGTVRDVQLNANSEFKTHDADLKTIATPPPTGAITAVASNVASVQLLAANANRKGALIYNDSTQVMYLALDNQNAVVTYSVIIQPASSFVLGHGDYTGRINAAWAVANGFARITEFV